MLNIRSDRSDCHEQCEARQENNVDVTNPILNSNEMNQNREQEQNPTDTPGSIRLKIVDGLFYALLLAMFICAILWSRG